MRRILEKFFKKRSEVLLLPKNDAEKRELFENITSLADEIRRNHPRRVVIELIRLLARFVQAYYMTLFLRTKDVDDLIDSVRAFKMLWFDPEIVLTTDGKTLNDLKKKVVPPRRLSLKSEPVLTIPWKSIVKTFDLACAVRNGEEEWVQKSDHAVFLWLPMNIAMAYSGHHSITAGVLAGEGEVMVDDVYDISEVYEHVETDGAYYIRKFDGKKIAPVNIVEFAAIFRIGEFLI